VTISAPLLTLVSHICVGCGTLACIAPEKLIDVSRWVKCALIVVSGMIISTLLLLLLLLASFPFDVRVIYACGCVGALLTALKIRAFHRHFFHGSTTEAVIPVLRVFVFVGVAALFLWVVVAALCLPSVDYDSIAIWGYRVRVLIEEKTLYTDSLRDPFRIAPMPKHPYFIPVLEASFCGNADFSYWACHLPHVLFYIAYLSLCVGAAREWFHGSMRWLALSALVVMPAPAVQWWLEGAREPAIGVLAVWNTYWFIRWLRKPTLLEVCLVAIGCAAMYHVKVEGAVLAGGWALAMVCSCISWGEARRARIHQTAFLLLIVGAVAVPWLVSKSLIPPSTQDYDFTEGFASGWGRRVNLIFPVLWMAVSEIILRPELYGLSPHLALGLLLVSFRSISARKLFLVLLPLGLCLCGIVAIYIVRQEQLGPSRNATFSRRFICVVPACVLASCWGVSQASRHQRFHVTTRETSL